MVRVQKKYIGFFLGIAAFLLIFLFADLKPGKPEVTATMAVAALMAIWWVSETIPLAVTALVPLVLFPALGVLDGRVRGAAVEALGRLGDDAAAAHVVSLLHDAVEAVRVQAARALGQLRAEAAMPDLVAALDDTSWWVRFRAAEALIRMGSRGVAVLRATAGQAGVGGEIATQVLAEMAVN